MQCTPVIAGEFGVGDGARWNGMPRSLVNVLQTDTDSGRWPYLDRLIDLNDMGLVAPEVWRLMCRLFQEYEAELAAMRERPAS